ncbi:hypothetical protein [Chamaesiphon sp.]|uniref:hypothetical protein n=1 Tax=Chamaesiphon sp. TaxID=2814140 RepID=UPI003592F20C
MTDETQGFKFESHEYYGEQLKRCQIQIEGLRASLISKYAKSSAKEAKQLEQAIEKIRLVQVSLHGRLSIEYGEKSDDELLPVYLGRLNK